MGKQSKFRALEITDLASFRKNPNKPLFYKKDGAYVKVGFLGTDPGDIVQISVEETNEQVELYFGETLWLPRNQLFMLR